MESPLKKSLLEDIKNIFKKQTGHMNVKIFIDPISSEYDVSSENNDSYVESLNIEKITLDILKLCSSDKLNLNIFCGILNNRIKPFKIKETAINLFEKKEISKDSFEKFTLQFESLKKEYEAFWEDYSALKKDTKEKIQ